MDIITKAYRDPATGTLYRVRIVPDEDASSPRDADNPTVMHTFDAGYYSPEDITQKGHHDSIFPSDYHDGGGEYGETRYGAYDFDLRRAKKYAALDPDILAVRGLDRGHDGTLRLSDDDETAGYIAITRKSWEMCMGDSPLEGGPWKLDEHGNPDPDSTRRTPSVDEVIAQELETYNIWARGEYVGYIVEERLTWHAVAEGRPDSRKTFYEWQEIDSCWGFDDQDYALEEARYNLPEGVEEI